MRCLLVAAVVSLAIAACGGSSPKAADTSVAPADAPQLPAADRCIADARPPSDRSAGEPLSITVKHVLVKHIDAERAGDGITRSRGDACLRAAKALDQLKQGTEFDEVVKQFSDEPGAATRGGMVGAIKRDEVDPAFADAAFALETDQVSNVVESKFGFHVIIRAE